VSGATSGVLSRAVLTTGGMAAQGVARLLYTVVIAHLAGAGAVGDTSALLSVMVYLSLMLPAGLGTGASRYLPLGDFAGVAIGVLNRWFWVSSTLLALAAAPIAFLLTHDPFAAIGCAILTWSYNAYVYTRGILMGEDRILRSLIADVGSSLLAITALVAVLLAGANWALLLPLAVGYGVFAFFARPRTRPSPSTAEQRGMLARFVRDATIGALATGGLLPATMVFVRAFDTPHQADLFAAALSLATPANMISQALNQVLIPHFAKLHLDPALMRQSHRRMVIATTAAFIVIFAAIIALSPFILSIFYPQKFVDGAGAMQALLVVVFFISTTCASAAYLVSAGRQKAFAMIWLTALIAGTVVMAVFSPLYGMWGALLGFAVGGIGGSVAVVVAAFLTTAPSPLSPALAAEAPEQP
jgi:O-antigen/teichoic acid export membrane protein